MLQLAGLAALPSLARAESLGESLGESFGEGWAERVHRRAAESPPAVLRADERATVAAIADGLLPRTDTPGALDVAAPAFVEVLVADWMTDEERTEFRSGIAAIEAHAAATHGRSWPALAPAQRDAELGWLEESGAADLERRTYRRLRGYLIHGFLTSERVRREVFKVDITPGRYRGDVPVAARGAGRE